MINSQPLGFYAPAQLVRDARDHGVEVRAVDVNYSIWDCTLEREVRGPWPVVRSKNATDNGLRTTDPSAPNLRTLVPFLRLGLRMVSGLAEAAARVIERAREDDPFASIDDFARRTRLGQAVVKRLAEADAFRSIGSGRRQALWQALAQEKKPRLLPLFEKGDKSNFVSPDAVSPPAPATKLDLSPFSEPALPPMQLQEEVVADYRSAGLSLRAHPISF
jgi:error-prone DNA polymerase